MLPLRFYTAIRLLLVPTARLGMALIGRSRSCAASVHRSGTAILLFADGRCLPLAVVACIRRTLRGNRLAVIVARVIVAACQSRQAQEAKREDGSALIHGYVSLSAFCRNAVYSPRRAAWIRYVFAPESSSYIRALPRKKSRFPAGTGNLFVAPASLHYACFAASFLYESQERRFTTDSEEALT